MNHSATNGRSEPLPRFLLAATGLFVAIAAAVPIGSPDRARADGPTVNGAGSGFAQLEIDQWRAEVRSEPYDLTLNYNPQGSSFGRSEYIGGRVDWAASDIPFTAQESTVLNRAEARSKDFVYVPVSAGGLGFMYNLTDAAGQRVTNLNLTRNAACRIFTEPNMRWNDTEIQNANPTVALPDQGIRPIVRADGSGTSYVLSEYCMTIAAPVWEKFRTLLANEPSVDEEFKQGRPTSNWPKQWGPGVGDALAADGVAAAVADPAGLYSITYNEAGFADKLGFPNANVENGVPGVFTQPTEEAVSIALGYATGRPDGTFILQYDGPSDKAYFPSTYSYVIAQTTGFPEDKGLVLAKFLCYAVTKGQRIQLTTKLHYARLSAPLVDIARNAIAQIPGAPPWDQCKVESAPPPPAATTTTAAPAPGGGSPTTTTTPPAPGGGGAGGGGAGGGGAGGGAGGAGGGAGGAGGGGGAGGDGAGGDGSGGDSSGGTGSGGNGSGGRGSTPTAGTTVTGGTTASGGAISTSTQVSTDPATGDTVLVGLYPVSESGCNDPLSGLPADPSLCADGASPSQGASAGGTTVAPVATPAKKNAPIGDSSQRPKTTQIVWWLVQGASVSAIGVALAGVRRRAT